MNKSKIGPMLISVVVTLIGVAGVVSGILGQPQSHSAQILGSMMVGAGLTASVFFGISND